MEWRPPAIKLKPRSKANHNKARTVLRLPDFEYATGTATSKASANSVTQTPYANAFMEPILVSAQLWLGYRQCRNYWLMIRFHACRSAHQWLALRMSSIHRAGRSSLLHCRHLQTGGTGLRQFRQSEIQNLGRPAVECAFFLGGHLGSSQRKGITGSACRWWSRGSTIAVLLDRSLCMRLAR